MLQLEPAHWLIFEKRPEKRTQTEVVREGNGCIEGQCLYTELCTNKERSVIAMERK
jgi:hypothetical protein